MTMVKHRMWVQLEIEANKHTVVNLVKDIPLWAVSRLGKQVRVVKDFDEDGDGEFVYRAGTMGTLDALQADGNGGTHALVEFEDGALVAFPFDHVEPVGWRQ